MTLLVGQIIPRQDTAANWTSENPVLGSFEQGFETDTGLSKRGDDVTEWVDLPYEVAQTPSSETRLISGGALTVINTDDLVVAACQFYIENFGTFSVAETTYPNIALSAAGLVRYVAIYGLSDGTLSKVEGTEGSQAVMPAGPSDSILINASLVTDGVVGASPDLSGYLLISSKATAATAQAGLNNTEYLTALAATGLKNPRVTTITSSATPSINVDLYDVLYISALATNITSVTVTGSLSPFRPIFIIFLDNGTARSITLGSSFVAMGEPLITTTTLGKVSTTAYLYFPSKSKLGCVGSKTEA